MVLTADHGSVVGRQFYGTYDPAPNYGFNNWYYGNVEQPLRHVPARRRTP